MPHQTNQPPPNMNMQAYHHQYPHPEGLYANYNQSQAPHLSLLSYHRHEAGYPFYNVNGLQHNMQQNQANLQGRSQSKSSSTSGDKQIEKGSIQQTDEEAAATALLMSAGAPTRIQQDHSDSNITPMNDRSGMTEICQVSPGSQDGTGMLESSPQKANTNEQDGDSITKEIRQKEMTITDDFPSVLHELLSGHSNLSLERITPSLCWMTCGKSWRVNNWKKLASFLSEFSPFPELCNVAEFLKEVEAWGFNKVCEEGGAVHFHHEFFIQIAPNLCKYMKPLKEKSPTKLNQIASPPRLGRYGRDLNDVINGKRKEAGVLDKKTKLNKLPRVDDDGNTTTTSSESAPVTPSFTLSTLVSPSSDSRGPQVAFVRDVSNAVESGSDQSPLRIRLQSNRGGRHNRGHLERSSATHEPHGYFPISNRGRRHVNVSTRGRGTRNHVVLPKQLRIPFTCNDDSSLLRPLSPRPN